VTKLIMIVQILTQTQTIAENEKKWTIKFPLGVKILRMIRFCNMT